MDYSDDDHIPSSRSKWEASSRDERTTDPPILKRKSTSDENLEPTKKQKLDTDLGNSDDIVVATAPPFLTCTQDPSPCKAVVTDKIPQSRDLKSRDEETEQRSSNCSMSETKQASDESFPGIPLNGNGSPSENIVNGEDVTGSEPYSVR